MIGNDGHDAFVGVVCVCVCVFGLDWIGLG
jgi:hypothetical protein